MQANDALPKAVQWTEGMLLSPQHLQQNDIHWQDQLRYLAQSMDPYFWGVRYLRIDQSRLLKGQLVVTDLEAILNDGTVIQYPQAFAGISMVQLSIDVSGGVKVGQPLRIWLVLPKRGSEAAVSSNPGRRFGSVMDPGVKDESIGNNSEPIDVARLLPLISLFAGSLPPVDSDYCPLLEVVLDANNQYQLGDYHPPMVCLGASDFLGDASLQNRLSVLKLQMWEKLRDLVRETGSESDNAQVSSDPATQQLLTIARHVAMSLPNLSIMADSPQTRPVTMYTVLTQVVGQTAPIGSSPMLPALSAYDHEDCFHGFDVVISYISRKLAQINLRYETLSFARVGQGSFGRRLPEDIQQNLVIELKPRNGESARTVAHWLHHSVICAIDLLPVLQERRLPGAHRKQLNDEAIAALGLRRGGLFFLLSNMRYDVDGVMQDTIQANQTLLIRGHGQASNAPFEIILHRPRRDPAAANTLIPTVMDEVSNAC